MSRRERGCSCVRVDVDGVILRCRTNGDLGDCADVRCVYLADPAGVYPSDLRIATHQDPFGRSVEVDDGAGADRLGGSLRYLDGTESVARRGEVDTRPGEEPNERVNLGAEGAFEPLDELVVARAGWTDPRLGRGHRHAGVEASPEGVERAEDLEPDVLASPIATQTAHRGGSSRL